MPALSTISIDLYFTIQSLSEDGFKKVLNGDLLKPFWEDELSREDAERLSDLFYRAKEEWKCE